MTDSRRTSRKATGPGRSTPRPGAPRSRRSRPSVVEEPVVEEKAGGVTLPKVAAGLGITQRAVALIVVLAVLALSYASSLRIYLQQQNDLATAQRQITERQQAIDSLNDQLARWQDPEYVKVQARAKLGWVMPGEVGYRVIGPDGKVIGGQVTSASGTQDSVNVPWYTKLYQSVQTADQPAPATTPTPAAEKTVTVSPAPSPTKR